jgi:hypothetical protein
LFKLAGCRTVELCNSHSDKEHRGLRLV